MVSIVKNGLSKQSLNYGLRLFAFYSMQWYERDNFMLFPRNEAISLPPMGK